MGRVEPDRGCGACDRPLEREPHHALRHRRACVVEELLDLFSVPRSMLPEVRPSSGTIGETVAGHGLPAGIPISGIVGDQQAALFGQACFRPGMTKNTYGTGSFVLMNVGPDVPPPVDGLLTTVAWMLADGSRAYVLEGAIFVTGAAVQWLHDGLGLIGESAEIGPLAESCPDTEGVYIVPAFTGLGSPYWDPYARGTIVGLTRGTGRAHLARAVVEAMILIRPADVVEAMEAASGRQRVALRVDGGATVMDLLLQLQADQLQVPVARPTIAETTGAGATCTWPVSRWESGARSTRSRRTGSSTASSRRSRHPPPPTSATPAGSGRGARHAPSRFSWRNGPSEAPSRQKPSRGVSGGRASGGRRYAPARRAPPAFARPKGATLAPQHELVGGFGERRPRDDLRT